MQVEQVDWDAAEKFRRGHGGKYDRDVAMMSTEFARHREAARIEGIRLGLEAAAGVCDAQREVFLSEEYAVGQPMSSFGERFACGSCSTAIRAVDPAMIGAGQLPQRADSGR